LHRLELMNFIDFIDFNKAINHRHRWLINFCGISQHSMTAKDIEMCALTGEIGVCMRRLQQA
jgi:hypothetical protein